MVQIPRWKVIASLVVIAFGFLYSAPNVIGESGQAWVQEHLPGWMPHKTVNLGLDLQGGSHLLLSVEVDVVLKERADTLEDSARKELRGEKLGYKRIGVIPNGVRVTLREPADGDAVRKILSKLEDGMEVTVDGDKVEAVFSEEYIEHTKDQVIGQSIEIVRRRIDETGTNEPVIQRQGDDRILVQLPGVDDPERVKDLLGKTAKMTFHLVDQDAGLDARNTGSTWIVPYVDEPTRTLALKRKEELSGDALTNAQYAQDQTGQSAVSFRFNTVGTKKFCELSRENVGRLFAIVLDKEIISAPVIREPICGGNGQISGNFSIKEANDLALLLRAGALPAPLTILEERTVGPSLGADSVAAGKVASIIGLFAVLVFMAVMYGLFGVFASIALFVNVALIFALLSGLQATLTLPGIAGIVLTIGMAVDANVLIFERIREEMRNGRSAIASVDAGYSRAMSTIVDSNLTTLIAAIILFSFGTGPVKGFAVTLAIGIVTSFFSAIVVTRLMVVGWLHNRKPTTLPV